MADHPVPIMTDTVWEQIRNKDLTSYGWTIGEDVYHLGMVRNDTEGGTKWVLVAWKHTPPWALPRAYIRTADEWNQIKGGVLDTDDNIITKNGSSYRLCYARDAEYSEEHPIELEIVQV